MDGVIASDVLENCHKILKEGSILVLKGVIEIDDYRSKEMGISSFRMRVKDIKLLDEELSKKLKKIEIDLSSSKIRSLDELSEIISSIDDDFWINALGCKINIKVITDESEAIIELGNKYNFVPDLDKLSKLIDIFGIDSLNFKK